MIANLASIALLPSMPETGFVRLPTILQHIPIARSTWWEGVRTGRFPTPVKIGGVTAWRAEDIRALIDKIGQHEPMRREAEGAARAGTRQPNRGGA
jgi:predicted DNA-binding transcriptional regulator AlpA